MDDRNDEILLDEALEQAEEQEQSLTELLGLEDDSENLELMKGVAKQGKEEAILKLGMAYLYGNGVEKDFAEACYWFEQSRDAMAMAQIAAVHEGEGNTELAVEYYRRAVSAPEDRYGTFRAAACISLALMLCSKEPEEADRYLRQAVSSGVPEEYRQTAYRLAGVLGGVFAQRKDLERALEWFRFSADGGCGDAGVKKQMVEACEEGMKQGPEGRFYQASMKLLEQLADTGEQLAVMTAFQYWNKNKDLPQSAEKYKEWLLKASDCGIEFAQFLLAREYLGAKDRRTDLPEDIGLARKYFDGCKAWISKVENGKDMAARLEAAIQAREKSAGKKDAVQGGVRPERILEQPEAEKIVERLSRNGDTVLVIQEGVTHIGCHAFDSGASTRMKYVRNIEKIRFPESVREIDSWAFARMDSLKEITLPPRLERLCGDAFTNSWVNFFNLWVRDRRVFQCIEIPACTELERDALFGICQIRTLKFLEGRKVLDWSFLGDKAWIGEVIVPDSVEKMLPFEPSFRKVRIERFSLPARLEEQFKTCIGKYCPRARVELR